MSSVFSAESHLCSCKNKVVARTNRVGTSKGTSFDSLRHTVISHLVNDKQVVANRIAVGLGQTPTGGVTQTIYTKTLSFRDYAQYFDLIDFDGWYGWSKIMS